MRALFGTRLNKRGKQCSICRAGLCNASIRNAPREATGCARAIPLENFAATVARRCTTYRLRWPRACGCVLARWAVTVRRAAPPGAPGNRSSRAFGPARPDDSVGASRPRLFSHSQAGNIFQSKEKVIPHPDNGFGMTMSRVRFSPSGRDAQEYPQGSGRILRAVRPKLLNPRSPAC